MAVSDLRRLPKTKKRILRLEHRPQRVHNGGGKHSYGELDQRIVALVKLLARRAADEDFRDAHDEG